MPNWIEGTMKIRGKENDIAAFIVNAIESVCETNDPNFDDVEFSLKDFAYVKGSRRAFVKDGCTVFINPLSKKLQTIAIPIRQAWSFTPYEGSESRWINLAKEYSVDIRLQGFECGIEFYQDFAVCNGKITIDEVKKYDDWLWDCPMPMMGG